VHEHVAVGRLRDRGPALCRVDAQARRLGGGQRDERGAGIHEEAHVRVVDRALGAEMAAPVGRKRHVLRTGGTRRRRLEMAPHFEALAPAVDLQLRPAGIGRKEDNAFRRSLSYGECSRGAAIDHDDRLAGKQADHVDVGGEGGRGEAGGDRGENGGGCLHRGVT
jgi:hypothetical protein